MKYNNKPSKTEIKQYMNFLSLSNGTMSNEKFVRQSPKPRAKPQHLESQEQMTFVNWCMTKGYPYNLIYAVENEGIKTPQAGARSKAMGKRAGVCDLFLPRTNRQYSGLYIEMKSRTGRLSDNQKKFIDIVKKEGYQAVVCYSKEEAISEISTYIQDDTRVM